MMLEFIVRGARYSLLMLGLLIVLMIMTLTLPSCSLIGAPERYRPHENFGDGGASRCGTINEPRQWLRPCE